MKVSLKKNKIEKMVLAHSFFLPVALIFQLTYKGN